MILLFFLTGKFPIFQSNDDIEALMEIATIIGKKKMEKTAMLHSELSLSFCIGILILRRLSHRPLFCDECSFDTPGGHDMACLC